MKLSILKTGGEKFSQVTADTEELELAFLGHWTQTQENLLYPATVEWQFMEMVGMRHGIVIELL